MNQRERSKEKSCENYSKMLASAGLLAVMFASASASRAQSTNSLSSAQKKAALATGYGKLPLSFEKNEGQADPRVKFLAHGEGYSLSLTRDGALLFLHSATDPKTQPESTATPQIKLVGANPNPVIVGTDELPGKVNYILGDDPKKWRTNLPTFAQVLYKDVYPGIDLVFHGNQGKLEFDFIIGPGADPNLIQIKDLGLNSLKLKPTGDLVAQVRGGELVLKKPVTYQKSGSEKQLLASNFIVKKNGRIAFNVASYDRSLPLVIDPQLVYSTFLEGAATLAIRPSAIAVDGLGEAIIVGEADSVYSVTAGAFEVTPPFQSFNAFVAKLNAAGTALVYATYLGGANALSNVGGLGSDGIDAVAADSSGNAYLTGAASSLDFPVTPTAFQTAPPCPTANQTPGHYCKASSAFVTVLNPAGTGLVYSTYFGGTRAVAAGSELVKIPSSTVPADVGTGIAVDPSGNIYVTGLTTSTDFPVTPGAPQTPQIVGSGSFVSRASFIAKFNPASSGSASLVYSTCLGASAGASQGSGTDTQTGGIAVDPQGNAYVTGIATWGPFDKPFPTTAGAFETVGAPIGQGAGTATSFVTKLNTLGTQFSYSTFYQGGIVNGFQDFGQTNAQAIAVDAKGSAYITGYTNGSGSSVGAVPTTPGAFQTSCDPQPPNNTQCSGDAFVAKFSPDGSSLTYSTYLGGSGDDVGLAIAVDSEGHAIVVGDTVPSGNATPPVTNNFPTTADALIPVCPVIPLLNDCSGNGFLSILAADGSALVYSTYLAGTGGNDIALGVTVDSTGNLFATGTTQSSDFPTTPGAFVGSLKQKLGGWAMKFGSSTVSLITVLPNALPSGAPQVPYGPITFTQTGGTGTITWSETGALPTGISFANGVLQGTPTQSGTFSISVTATDQIGNTGTANLSLTIGGLLSVSPTSVPAGGVNLGYNVPFTATGATGTVTWSATGLPTGLTITGGVLFGIPTVAGTFPLQITATDANNNTGSVSVSLLIYPGTTASISLPPCSAAAVGTTLAVNFPNTAVGTSSTQTVCLNNTGSNNLYVEGFISFSLPTSPISITSDSCPLLGTAAPSPTNGLSAGQSCQLTFQFQPTAIATYSPSLKILDSGGSQIVNFAAAGVAPPFASFSPTQLNFGSIAVNTPANQTGTLTNTGAGPLTLNFLGLGFQPPGFSVLQVVCNGVAEPNSALSSLTINPTQSCSFTVQFDPATAGPFSAQLGFADNAASGQSNLPNTIILGSNVQVVVLSGTGVAPARSLVSIAVTPANPSIGVGATQQFAATGTYSDSSTQDLTTSVNWSSTSTSSTIVATINSSSGLATGVAAGTATIQANLGSVTSLPVTLTVTAATGGGGTPACGCSKTGSYVAPNNGSAPTNLTVSGGSVTVTSGGNTLFTLSSLPSGTAAGLSPDNRTLEVNVPGQGVSLYNLTSTPIGGLIGPSPLISNAIGAPSRIQFSASGQYLAYTTAATPVGGQNGSATIMIYNVRTGKMVYENSNINFLYPSGGTSGIQDASGKALSVDAFGNVGDWGFSPDAPETSFAFGFLTDASNIQWNLVHLEQSPTTNTVGSAKAISLKNITSAFWQFSPCGDVIGIVTQASALAEVQFIRTVDGTQVGDSSGLPAGNITLSSNSMQQMATDMSSSGTQTTSQLYTVDDSANNLGCSNLNTPPGSNVTVQPPASGSVPSGTLSAPATINFPSVNAPGGQISLTVSKTPPPPPNNSGPPPAFSLGTPAVYYDFAENPNPLPTADFPATICINYSGVTFMGQPVLYHLVSGISTNITTSTDTVNQIVCGTTTSLSPFAIFSATGPVSTTTTLTSSVNSATVGQTVTLTALVTPSLVGTPTGTIAFSDGSTVLGTASLGSSSSASITTTMLGAGPHSITATYSADTYFAGSTSSTLALTVTPASLTVTANSNSRQYGSVDPMFTSSYSGFVNGDGPGSLSGTLTCTAGDTTSSPVGTYAIYCSGLSSTNYAITYRTGTLTITPAPLIVAANNASRPYGANNPVFTGTITGLLNTDPISATFISAATPASLVGTSAIVPTLLGAPSVLGNYAISVVNGTLNVVPEATSLTVTLSPSAIPVGLSTTATVTLSAPDMVIPINPSVLAPIAVSSPILSDILSNNGTCTPVPASAPGTAACTITLTAVEPNGRTLNASFSGSTALTASTGTADLLVTAPLESKMSCINSDFRNVSVPGGSYIWFNSIFKVRDVAKQKVTITFFQSSVRFQYTDATGTLVKVNQPMPDARIIIDPSVTSASTSFDSVNNVWITTIPFDLDDNSFLTGLPWIVPAAGLPADVEPVTWCGTFASDTAGIDIGWRWAAAAYSSFSADNTTLGVKPMDSDHDNPASNHDDAGTPENFKTFIIPGARSKRHTNYTGSYSGSANIE